MAIGVKQSHILVTREIKEIDKGYSDAIIANSIIEWTARYSGPLYEYDLVSNKIMDKGHPSIEVEASGGSYEEAVTNLNKIFEEQNWILF